MREYITSIDPNAWVEPSDWIDINTVADNEILLLVTEGAGIGFVVNVGTGTGTFSIDWGDGVIESGLVGNGTTVFQHQHTTGGKPCSLGYNTWKVRISGASENITIWKIAKHTYTNSLQYPPILSANLGTSYITDYSYAFYNTATRCSVMRKCKIKSFEACSSTSQMFTSNWNLASLTLPSSWGNVTNTSYMLNATYLKSITLPSSWGNVTNTSNMFRNCYDITSITLPSSWGNVTDVSYMFSTAYSILRINLPPSWGNVTNVSNMFSACWVLPSIILPSSWGNVTDVSSMFKNCFALKTINNLEYLGSIGTQSNFVDFLSGSDFLQQDIIIGSLLSAVGIYGATGKVLKCTSLRLTNAGSLFAGTSPQVNVSYSSLDATALDLLFGDLQALTGKTINITGCAGAASCTRTIATTKGWTVIG